MPILLQIGVLFLMAIISNAKILISGLARINNTISALQFNTIVFLVVGGAFLPVLIANPVSSFTLLTAILYAAVTIVYQVFYVMALEKGPVSIIVLIVNFSAVVTTIVGTLVFKEGLRYTSLIGLGFIIISLLLTVKSGEHKRDNKGFVYAFISMLATVAATLIQRFHQKTEFADERNSFLCAAYLLAALMTTLLLLLSKKKKSKPLPRLEKHFAISGLGTGAVLVAYQFMVMYLSGKVNSMLMYPMLTGFTMTINIILCRLFLGEKMNPKQKLGFIVGAVAIIIIAL